MSSGTFIFALPLDVVFSAEVKIDCMFMKCRGLWCICCQVSPAK